MNKKILALLLFVIPVVFYILQYNDIIPAIYMWGSLVAVLLINLFILLPINRNKANR